jgi:Beta-propeller repeat
LGRPYDGPGNASDDARAIMLDSTGNVYVTGGSTGASGFLDYATLKYSATGSQLWVARYDGPGHGDDDAKGLAVDSSGNAYVTGYSLSAATSNDYSTIKYDTSGNQIWVANYDGPANGNDQAVGIALDSGGNVYVTGASSGIGTNVDYATTKYDSSGNHVWVARFDGSAHGGDYASAIALDSSGNVHVTGRSFGGVGTWNDYATIRYNQDGVQTRENRYDGPGHFDDFAAALAVDQNGNVYVTGSSFSDGSTGNDSRRLNTRSRQWLIRTPRLR